MRPAHLQAQFHSSRSFAGASLKLRLSFMLRASSLMSRIVWISQTSAAEAKTGVHKDSSFSFGGAFIAFRIGVKQGECIYFLIWL